MSKPNLILLHGALGAQSQFDPWIPVLSPHFELHRIEFEGHGAQPFADRPFRIEHFADNLAAAVTERNLQGAFVFGYSMGGYVALYESLRQPESFGKIFTLATKFDWNAESSEKESKMLNPDVIQEKVPHFAEALRQRHHGNTWREHLGRTAEMMLDLGASPRLTAENLAQVSVPCRISVGSKDRMVSQAETQWAQSSIPNAEFLLLENIPHPIEKIAPESLLSQFLDFFS